jgi:pimeloyl-ACP methyl ester carboxylesterase
MSTSLSASIEPRLRTIDGLNIRYADTGGSHESTLLLTSPGPESLYAFASMWAVLAEHARLFGVDLPGFGASERRDDLLSPARDGRIPGQARRRSRAGTAAHLRAGRRDVGGPVRGGGASRQLLERNRRHRWSRGPDPAR